MCDNEYVAHVMVRERIREAEARGAFNAMVRESEVRTGEATRLGRGAAVRAQRGGWVTAWWHAAPAWLAHLTLPKTWNRL
jgi:hypothetical protein